MTVSSITVLIYACLNILACIVFAYDKLKATMKGWRISETSLLLVAALGPFGALIAMVGYRHKTRHMKFLLVPVFALLHLLLAAVVWSQIAGYTGW